jgi:hypothetical protein
MHETFKKNSYQLEIEKPFNEKIEPDGREKKTFITNEGKKHLC